MRVVVTGARGQVGSEICALLDSEGRHEVIGLHRGNADLTDRDAVLGAITSVAPDIVIHAGAMTAVDLCETEPESAWAANALGTRFVADGARRVGAHLVLVSTDYVFDGTKGSPYLEWDPLSPLSAYGRSKAAAEAELDPGWTVARTSWVCGAVGANMVKTILRLAAQPGPLRFVDDQRGRPTLARDLAAMLVKLALERVPGTFHTTNQRAVSWYEFAREVLTTAGGDPARVEPIATVDLDPPRPAPRPANAELGDLAWRGHGFTPSRDFRPALEELVSELGAR